MLFPLESPPFVPINEAVFQIGIPKPANGICETPVGREASMRPHRADIDSSSALWGLTEASRPTAVSHVPFAALGIPICNTASLIGSKCGDYSGTRLRHHSPH